MDHFANEVLHFLDIKTSPLALTIYRKNTHTDQYVNFEIILLGITKSAGFEVRYQPDM